MKKLINKQVSERNKMEEKDKEEKRDLDPDEEAENRFPSANFTCAET